MAHCVLGVEWLLDHNQAKKLVSISSQEALKTILRS